MPHSRKQRKRKNRPRSRSIRENALLGIKMPAHKTEKNYQNNDFLDQIQVEESGFLDYYGFTADFAFAELDG